MWVKDLCLGLGWIALVFAVLMVLLSLFDIGQYSESTKARVFAEAAAFFAVAIYYKNQASA